MKPTGLLLRFASQMVINPPTREPFPLHVDAALLSDQLREGDIVTLGSTESPARDWRTGIPVPSSQQFRIVSK